MKHSNPSAPFFKGIYDRLKLPLLQIFAEQWGKAHPCIHRITLYLAGPENEGIEYVLAVNAPEFPSRKLPKDESEWTDEDENDWQIIKYHNWAQGFDSHCQHDIEKIHKKDPEKDLIDNHIYKWMWFTLGLDEGVEEYNNALGVDFVLTDTEYILYEVAPLPDKSIKETKSQADDQIIKYTELAIKYCKAFIDNGEQPLSRTEVEILLAQELKKAGDTLGPKIALPEGRLRKIWEKVPSDLKRRIGVKTQKRRFELKAGSLPWQI